MKKNVPMKRFACFALSVLLLCLVLAGCGSTAESAGSGIVSSSFSVAPPTSSSSSTNTEDDEFDVTQTAAYQNAEPWQQAYYDVCEERGLEYESVKLLIPDSGIPLLITPNNLVEEVPDADENYQCWKYENGAANVIYEADRYTSFPFINKVTGNLVVYEPEFEQIDDIYSTWFKRTANVTPRWYEVDGANKTLLDRTTQYHADVTPLDAETITDGQTGVALILLLDLYQPAIPEGAPSWVAEHMKYLYANGYYKDYTPGYTLRLFFLPPLYSGGAPVIWCDGLLYNSAEDICQFVTADGVFSVVIGQHLGGGVSGTLYKDENGQTLLYMGNNYIGAGNSTWYSVDQYGFSVLFYEGYYSEGEEYFYYCDGVDPVIDIDQQRAQTLAKYGYTGNLTQLDPDESVRYPGDAEVDTDNIFFQQGGQMCVIEASTSREEYETALIDALCDYAKSIGDWNG